MSFLLPMGIRPFGIVVASGMLLAGCSAAERDPMALSSGSQIPNSAAAPATTFDFATTMRTVGHFRLSWDPAAEQASIMNVPLERRGALQGDLYYLPTSAFQTPATLIQNTADPGTCASCWRFEYAISHPFAAPPDPLGEATGANRADLGFSGQVLLMSPAPPNRSIDTASNRFRGDYEFAFNTSGLDTTIIANSKLVKNADGYINPHGTIDLDRLPPMNGANAWPFRQLVDESLDPRLTALPSAGGVAISNGGSPTGNYDPLQGGWQFGLDGTQVPWTGFGILHQGQTATNAIILDIAELTTLSLEGLVVAKYTDPRGGTTSFNQRANRLPLTSGPSFFPNKFAYRMPWGAIDISHVTGTAPVLNGATPGTLIVRYEDFDFAAVTDPAFPSIGANLDQIPVGTDGMKSMRLASTELGLNQITAIVTNGTGMPATPVRVDISIANNGGGTGGVDGVAYVMALIVDKEQDLSASGFSVRTMDDSFPPKEMTNPADKYLPTVCQVFKIDVL